MAFDMPSNHPACSPSVFGHTNNEDTSPFGTTSPFGAQTGGSNSSSTGLFVGSPVFGTTSLFGGARATTPAFGNPFLSQFNQPSSAQSFPFGACGFNQLPVGSRVYSYAQTPEELYWNGGPQPSYLESISAMPAYQGKSHEELRWDDYQSGDKGGPNPTGQSSVETEFKTNNMRSNLFSRSFGPATSPFSSNPFAQRPQTTFGIPGFVSSSHTHNSSPFAPPASAPAQSQTPSPSSNPFSETTFCTPGFVSSSHTLNSSPFGPPTFAPAQSPPPTSHPFVIPLSPSPFSTPDTSNPFSPAQAQTPSVICTTQSNPFGPQTSHSLFGTPNTSGFGTPSSVPTFGVSVTVAFGAPTNPVSGAPAFTASSTPAFASLPTPANGATSFSFSFSFPVFGQSASARGSSPSPFGPQSSPSGAHATAPNYGSSSSGQPYQQHMGSILPPYPQTTEIFRSNGTQPDEKLESISATRTYKEKCHEEFRWKDYQSGDKGSQTSNISGSAQSQTPSLFRAANIFGASTLAPFGAPNTSNPGTLTSIFGTTQARGTNSMFGNTQSSPLFQSSSAAVGQMNSLCGYMGLSFGQTTSPSSGTPSPGFGARTLPSPSDTPNTPTSVSGSIPGLEATVSPSTVSPSPVGSELSIGTQSANLFQSSSPDLGQTSSPLEQTGIAFEQSTSAAVSQSNASEGTFSSTQLGTSSTGFNQTTSSFSTSSQFAQLIQSPASSHLVESTGSTGSTSNVSSIDQAE